MRLLLLGVPLTAAALLASGCSSGDDELLLGATTSLQDAGVLDKLITAFEDGHDYDVKPIVQGSGQILELARRGELDVIMTHSPTEETAFINEGYGVDRTPVLQNDFVIAGPPEDPARVSEATDITDAFQRIADSESAFVSRGDRSGTHIRELWIWDELGIRPGGQAWYRESGAGQGQSLLLAGDTAAYTMVDDSTFVTFSDRIELTELSRDTADPNVYSVVRLNAVRLTHVNERAADAWLEFMTSDAARQIILSFGEEEYGRPLFEPVR